MTGPEKIHLLQAHGRCTGATIFAIFGGCWLLLSCAYFHLFNPPEVVAICLLLGLLVSVALRTRKGHVEPTLDGQLQQQKQREDRQFVLLNVITYGIVFTLFLLLPRLQLSNYIFPSFVALVGLHFFPMPSLYRHTANFVVGGFMVLWALFCAVRFKADGNTMAAWVALGAGLALWCGSLWALGTASRLFKTAALGNDQADAR